MTPRLLLLSLALLAAATGCPKAPATDPFCPASFCAGHGTCVNSNTIPVCTCDDGYTGVTCGSCAAGFHRQGSDACAADQLCTTGLCGDHGTCAVTAGVAACSCAPGYLGALCAGCAPGFRFVPTLPDGGFLDGGTRPPTRTPGAAAAGRATEALSCRSRSTPASYRASASRSRSARRRRARPTGPATPRRASSCVPARARIARPAPPAPAADTAPATTPRATPSAPRAIRATRVLRATRATPVTASRTEAPAR